MIIGILKTYIAWLVWRDRLLYSVEVLDFHGVENHFWQMLNDDFWESDVTVKFLIDCVVWERG